MKIYKLTVLAFVIILTSCQKKELQQGYIDIQNEKFIDSKGNQIIFHGINYVNKSAKIDPVNFSNPENFKLMKKWGFNCIRLGVTWAGVEPQPGVYDEAFLKDLDYQIKLAEEHEIFVFIDMHQDLFSQLYSDGAPEWATLSEEEPHTKLSPVWSDAYFTSPAVKTSITNFWQNKPANDGVGIQERYIAMWRMLAERYVNNRTVIGFDLMNEPNIGWGNSRGQELMIRAFIEAYAKQTRIIFSDEEVIEKWLDPVGRSEILGFLSDADIYAGVVDAMYPIYSVFEREQLMPFFEKTTKAIREVNKDHLIFLETSMSSNMGVKTAIARIEGENKLVYAPHGYDLVVDTQDYTSTNNTRVNFIFNRHLESSMKLKMPLIIGEWGAFGANGDAFQSALQVTKFFEKAMCSDAYWTFNADLDNSKLLKAISRAVPEKITGDLIAYNTNVEEGNAVFEWNEKLEGTNRIFIPKFYNLEKSDIELSPKGEGFDLIKTDGGWYLGIPSILNQRKLKITNIKK